MADAFRAFDADEAERLASMIKPAWEIDGDDDAPPPAETAEAARPSGAEAPAHDTLVDGVPSVEVGTTDPGASPVGEAAVPDREAPKPAGPTRMGVGDSAEEIAAREADEAPKVEPAKRRSRDREVTEAVGRPLVSAEDIPPSSRPASGRGGARTPVAPQGASFSKIEDPIEIPVENKSRGMIYGLGGAAVVLVIVIGYFATRGDSGPTTSTATSTAKPVVTATAKPTPAETAKPAATATPTPEPTATATPEPTATASAAATAEPTATAAAKTAEPIAAAPKPTSKPASGGTKPTATSGGTKPPSGGGTKGSGGIMRDAPF